MGKVHPNSLANLKPFTKEYRPKRPGKKPSKLKKYMKECQVGIEDIRHMMANVIFPKNEEELKKLLIEPKTPMIIRLFVRSFLEDFKQGKLDNFEKFMDRIYGKPKQEIDSNVDINIHERAAENIRRVFDELPPITKADFDVLRGDFKDD